MTTTKWALLFFATWLLGGCAYWFDTSKPVEKKSATREPTTKATAGPAAKPMPEPAPGGEVVRLKGSTTVGADLAPKLASGFLASIGATDIGTREGTKAENRVRVTGLVKGVPVTFDVLYPGSGAAFECLEAGACDIGMSSRPIQAEEVEKLKDAGDMTSMSCEHVLALDGIAVVVNRANRLNKLTVQQIAGVFTGDTKTWDKVGGAPKEIHLITRDKTSGTYDSFVHFALHGRDVSDKAKSVDDNEAVAATVAKDELAIGFVGLPYVGDTKAVAVQDGAAALAPSTMTVGTEDYAFSRRLFFYTPEKAKPLVQQFVEYALSDAGQGIVPETGFVSLKVQAASVPAAGDAPEAYAKATVGAQRLSFNFRFRGASAKLDPRSSKDLERLARFIRVTTSNARSVSLFGFMDDQGNEGKAVELSRQRAQAIAEQLRGRGVEAQQVDGFGSALPVAPNDTPTNRARNRRVEVWLR